MMEFVEGPLLYLSIAVFFIGLTARAVMYIRGLSQKLDRVAYRAHLGRGLVGAFVSIFKWMIPGGTRGWRTQPVMMIFFFMLHAGIILLPFFLLAHTVSMQYYFGFSFPALPACAADILTISAIIGLFGLAARRVFVVEARVLTTSQDWLIILLTAAPLITGAIARFYGGESYEMWIFAHILTAEIFLIAAPFTKLSHIVLYFLSRAQIGMDFAIKRGGQTRGSAFPW